MVTISAIDFPSRRAVEVPWTRPGPLPEAAWVCGQCWEADLAHEDLVLAYGPSVCERTLLLDAGEQGWLIALMPATHVGGGAK